MRDRIWDRTPSHRRATPFGKRLIAWTSRYIDLETATDEELRILMEAARLDRDGIREWQARVHELAKQKGWWQEPVSIPEKLALIHSEVSEVLEAYRDGVMETVISESGKPEGVPSELADVVIRGLDLCGHLGIDLESAIELKHRYNQSRPFRHGNKRA